MPEETTEKVEIKTEEKKEPTAAELQAIIAEKEKAILERDQRIAGLTDKEFNFKKLREMTESEKADLTAKETELLQRQEELEEKTKKFTESQINSHKADALSVLAGDDSDLRGKIEYHYGRIQGEAVTREQVQAKMREAALLAGATNTQAIDPFGRATGYIASAAPKTSSPKELSPEQQDLAKKFGISQEDINKYVK